MTATLPIDALTLYDLEPPNGLRFVSPPGLPIDALTLYDLEQRCGLQAVADPCFFPEWQADCPALSESELARLARIRAAYANLERRAVLENTVKLAVVAPLLDLAGFFLPPFYVTTEQTVEIAANDGEAILRGRLDILVLHEQFWLLVIETKRAEFSLKVGIPQVLSYMLSAPATQTTRFGLVTNGSSFVFLKLQRDAVPRYACSKELLLNQDAGLERTLQIMKHLASLLATAP